MYTVTLFGSMTITAKVHRASTHWKMDFEEAGGIHLAQEAGKGQDSSRNGGCGGLEVMHGRLLWQGETSLDNILVRVHVRRPRAHCNIRPPRHLIELQKSLVDNDSIHPLLLLVGCAENSPCSVPCLLRLPQICGIESMFYEFLRSDDRQPPRPLWLYLSTTLSSIPTN
jgi:hypothetical protein